VEKEMRKKFPWYFFDSSDYDVDWDEVILTVDANVMLDLYRYNQATREALLVALESFKGRFWISHQTSIEFVRNRRIVISDMINEFENASNPIRNIESAINKAMGDIRGFRAIPKELIETFDADFMSACVRAREAIEKEKKAVPAFSTKDEVVQRIEAALEGQIGNKPSDITKDLDEAKRRRDNEIPPGYKDAKKPGLGFAGDYLMWNQILSHSKDRKKSVLFVTSENKEDWWEIKNGKTLNPRLELLEEAFEATGHKILIYHTDHFLKLHQESITGKSDESVLTEIREYYQAREPAVSVVQTEHHSDAFSRRGEIRITIARPLRNFTGTGRFKPALSVSPEVKVFILECPIDSPSITARANTGTTYDFNVHINSEEKGKVLPAGEYLLEYEALCGTLGENGGGKEATERPLVG
jgi:hypothetical protein